MAAALNTFVHFFNNRLEAPVRQHLKNVYGCLSLLTVSAAAGAYVHMYSQLLQANFFTMLCTFGLLFTVVLTPDNGKNQKFRLSCVLGLAFLSGLGLGPLLELVVSINPSIVVTALIGTTVIFVSFSISALLAKRGSWLYLGGTLFSLLNIMALVSLANLFLRSALLYQAHIYGGLFLMCTFVIYDTQMIIEKHEMGSKDFIMHSLELFVDFISVFRHLLVILTQKELSKEQRKRRAYA